MKTPNKSGANKRKAAEVMTELLLHLEYCPFLNLNVQFDPGPALREALELKDRFVIHREKDQVSVGKGYHWKSLSLRSEGGDERLTGVSRKKNPIGIMNTPIVEEVPETIRILNGIVDWESCGRIRFMTLGAGVKIQTHRDYPGQSVHCSVNISLNMPRGCNFWVDVNQDGSSNAYSRKVPFQNSGSAFLFNPTKFHRIENRSRKQRIHLIAAGPCLMPPERLLRLARRQNGLSGIGNLTRALMQKKAILQEPLLPDSVLYHL